MIVVKATAKCDGVRYGLIGCEDRATCEVELCLRTEERYTDGEDQHTHGVELFKFEVVDLPEGWKDIGCRYADYIVQCPACVKKDTIK